MEYGEKLMEELKRHLVSAGKLDEMLPVCPDVEELWPSVKAAYMPDGVKEFADYPLVSLGWIMFVGMALAKYWDVDWEKYSKESGEELYRKLRDARGFDNLDDYVLEDVLGLDKEEAEKSSEMVGQCAAIAYHSLTTSEFEAGSADAAKAYVAALHRLYMMGIYTELNALGYHMTKM